MKDQFSRKVKPSQKGSRARNGSQRGLKADSPSDPPPLGQTSDGSARLWQSFKLLLSTPVSGASLAVFRIAVGLVMTAEAYSLFQPSQSTAGAIMLDNYYTGPDIKLYFPYPGFQWLPLLPAGWIRGLVCLQGL